MKKIFLKIYLIFFLLLVLAYITNITSIPNDIILFKGEEMNLGLTLGLSIKENKAVETVSSINMANKVEKKKATLSLFNVLDVKEIEITTINNTKVIPLGNSVGLKLYTSGVLVVGMTEIEGRKPYENSGIEEGDMIIQINNEEITCTSELIECVKSSKGENLNVKYIRDGQEYVAAIDPIKTKENEYKLGLWVRDGAAGIGTISYYEPSTKKFAALGHGIIDIDTEELINISSGELVTSKISSIVKGEEGVPGEIKGSIVNGETIGNVSDNSRFGIYGDVTDISKLSANSSNEIEVATRNEIKEGKAKILLDIENGVRKEYEIEITKIYRNNNSDNKSMLIKVIDEELLKLTGGIVQRHEWSSNYTKQ